MRDSDAAGIMFFGKYYFIAHDAYEAFMESVNCSLKTFIDESDYMPLIVHSEADYKKPLKYGEQFEIEIEVSNIGDSSFTLVYNIRNSTGETVANVKTVHVAVNLASRKKCPLPEDFKSKLRS